MAGFIKAINKALETGSLIKGIQRLVDYLCGAAVRIYKRLHLLENSGCVQLMVKRNLTKSLAENAGNGLSKHKKLILGI